MAAPTRGLGAFLVSSDTTSVRRLLAGDHAVTEAFGALLRDGLEDPAGCLLVTGLVDLDASEARAFILTVSGLLGHLLPQDAEGALLREVRYRGVRLGEGATGRYSSSRDGGSLHTDGPHAPGEPPDHFALFCVRQSAQGGELVLVHREDLLARLSPEAVTVLREDFHFDRRSSAVEEPTVVRPVLTDRRISYLRDYIDLGHAHPHVPDLEPGQRRALSELDALLDDSALWRIGKLAPGELLVVDNARVCHGRTPFTDGDDGPGRLLLRTWIRTAQRVAR